MNSKIKEIENIGFYFPHKEWVGNYEEESAYKSYYKSTRRRLFSPGAAPEAIVVRYYCYGGLYQEKLQIESQYVYFSIYDAMRQVLAYKMEEYSGKIDLLIYTDNAGLELIRSWEYELEGYYDMDGDAQIDSCGWVKVS